MLAKRVMPRASEPLTVEAVLAAAAARLGEPYSPAAARLLDGNGVKWAWQLHHLSDHDWDRLGVSLGLKTAAKAELSDPSAVMAIDAAGAGENLYAKGSFTDDTYKTMQGQSRGRRSDSKALLARPSATAQGGGASRQIPTTSTAHAPKGAQSNDVSAARTYALAVARGKSGTSSSSTFRTGLSKKRTFASSTGAASKSSYMRHGFNGLGGTHKVILNTSDRRKVQRGGHLLSKKAPPRQKQQLKVNNFFQR